ncbi:MAG: HlyD family secretion protein [Bacteroidia bacterium]
MMILRRFNVFYLAVILCGILLFIFLRPERENELSFFGFAENNETEINYNYPVVVEKILVTPGQEVKAGQELLHVVRRKSRETMPDHRYRIAELKAEESLWRQKKQSQLRELETASEAAIAVVQTSIEQLRNELAFKRSLAKGLETVAAKAGSYKPLEERLEALELEEKSLREKHALRLKNLKSELNIGANPYQKQVERLEAEGEFEASQQEISIVVKAPTDGLIGNISCKEEEHVSSYTTLMSFYEPHSGIIQGYIHEDLTLKVNLGDKYEVSSLKSAGISYEGTVIGLGSRIVEIPTRLRKIPDYKTYGREVLVGIDKNNDFLQKEKVSLRLTASQASN